MSSTHETIARIGDLREWIEDALDAPLSLLVGEPGTGKSTLVREVAAAEGREVVEVEGHISPRGYYDAVAKATAADALLLLDDVDAMLADRELRGLLKASCGRPGVRLAWQIAGGGDSVAVTCPILIVANAITPTMERHLGAILSRADSATWRPPAQELHDMAGEWADGEVHRWMSDHLPLLVRPDLRFYAKGLSYKHRKRDWQGKLLARIRRGDATMGEQERAAHAKLVAYVEAQRKGGKLLRSNKAREARWAELTGLGRSAYYIWQGHYKRLHSLASNLPRGQSANGRSIVELLGLGLPEDEAGDEAGDEPEVTPSGEPEPERRKAPRPRARKAKATKAKAAKPRPIKASEAKAIAERRDKRAGR